jgi:hypothetical protein
VASGRSVGRAPVQRSTPPASRRTAIPGASASPASRTRRACRACSAQWLSRAVPMPARRSRAGSIAR